MNKISLFDYDHLMDLSEMDLTVKERVNMYCHQCCCFQSTEVKACDSKDCPLWVLKEKWYKIPRKSSMTDEQRKAASERMKKMQQDKKMK
jgi:hypothetical protein